MSNRKHSRIRGSATGSRPERNGVAMPKVKNRHQNVNYGLYNAQLRELQREIRDFAVGYPNKWTSRKNLLEKPIDRVIRRFVRAISSDAARVARLRGMELRLAYGYKAPEQRDEAAADLLRGVASLAIDELHGPISTSCTAGDRMTAEQAAFYVADDWWHGRDGLEIDQWADIRQIRHQIMLDAVVRPREERKDVLGFSTAFIERHPALIREAEWALRLVGSGEGFTRKVWAATGRDDLWRGVYFFAEVVIADMRDAQRMTEGREKAK